MVRLLTGGPVHEIAVPLEQALARAESSVDNWDTRAALLWVLVTAERYATVDGAIEALLTQVHRSGSARGFVAAYSTLGLLKLRLGALPEADAAARVALRVLQEGDFAPGLGFAATILADVATEAGEYDEAQAFLDLLPQSDWPAGVGTALMDACDWPSAAMPRRSRILKSVCRCVTRMPGASQRTKRDTRMRVRAPHLHSWASASDSELENWRRPN